MLRVHILKASEKISTLTLKKVAAYSLLAVAISILVGFSALGLTRSLSDFKPDWDGVNVVLTVLLALPVAILGSVAAVLLALLGLSIANRQDLMAQTQFALDFWAQKKVVLEQASAVVRDSRTHFHKIADVILRMPYAKNEASELEVELNNALGAAIKFIDQASENFPQPDFQWANFWLASDLSFLAKILRSQETVEDESYEANQYEEISKKFENEGAALASEVTNWADFASNTNTSFILQSLLRADLLPGSRERVRAEVAGSYVSGQYFSAKGARSIKLICLAGEECDYKITTADTATKDGEFAHTTSPNFSFIKQILLALLFWADGKRLHGVFSTALDLFPTKSEFKGATDIHAVLIEEINRALPPLPFADALINDMLKKRLTQVAIERKTDTINLATVSAR